MEALVLLVCLQQSGEACSKASEAYYRQSGLEADVNHRLDYYQYKYSDVIKIYQPYALTINMIINQRVEFRSTFP